ncbi:MAG: SusC/RagA family TonB-linked outer membrane protein [Bacteroidales bacterium]|nr:SusC/RagA family TonB-linked outer membrane protein [Bacteroidales bacterium]
MKINKTTIFSGLAAIMSCAFVAANAQEPGDTSVTGGVTVPSIELPCWQIAGAVSRISGEELSDSYISNVANTLFGRIPGLTVQGSGAEPGSDSPVLSSRGIGTFGSGSGLFFVIDGFASTQDFFERLTPGEIESIELLKDASATALYGNRAANGVLLVKTRHGKNTPLKIDFGVRAGFQQPLRLPQWLGAYDYATLYNEALSNEGKSPLYSTADLDAYAAGDSPMLYPDINWQDEIMSRMSPVVVYNLTASGGGNAVKYLVHFNGVNNMGLLRDPSGVNDFARKQSFSRYNFRTNVDISLTKRLTASVILGGSIEDKVTPGVTESTWNVIDLAATVPPNAFPVLASATKVGGNAAYSNPVAELTERGYVSYNGRTAQASIRLSERLDFITKGLWVTGAISFNNFYKSYSSKTRSYARYSPVKDSSGEISFVQYGEDTALGGDESSSWQWRNIVADAAINYDRVFGGKHYVNGLLKFDYDEYTVTGTTLPFKNLGFGGRFSYSYDKRYIAEFTFGYRGNDNFPAGSRYGFFPAGAVAWVISEEGFLKGSRAVNHLKIRASYGLVGNADIGGSRYMQNQYYNWGGNYWFGSSNSAADTYFEGEKANPFVTWEKDRKLNVGIEARFVNNLYFTFDWFRAHRYDILTKPWSSVPDWLGFSKPSMNIGIVDNTGFEAVLGWRESEKEFRYKVEASAWYAHNNVVFNSESPQVYSYRYSTGHPVGQPFVLEAIGFFRDYDDIENSPKQIFAENVPGDIKYKDQNGDNKIDEDDFFPMGYTSRPEITLALDLGFEYKGFDLQMLFQGAMNRTVYLEGKAYWAFQNNGKVTDMALGRWTPQTADTAVYPRLSTNGEKNNFQYSSFWQRKGDFLKLRSLSFGYTVSTPAMKKAHIDGLRIYVSGTNLFSLDYMQGFCDPEVLYGYPAVRTCSLGFNIKF